MAANAPGLANDMEVLAFAADAISSGGAAALATIVGVDGPFSRPVGAQLAIRGDGSFAGSISGGCLETALCEQAVSAIEKQTNQLLRYGAGSQFIDVRLPCGGGLDIFLDVHLEADTLRQAIEAVEKRRVMRLAIDPASASGSMSIIADEIAGGSRAFVRSYHPRLRLVLAGRGWEIVALSKLASESGFDVVVASQEQSTLGYCEPHASELIHLKTPASASLSDLDAHSALVCLFHEHEWESAILKQGLGSSAFFVGALGSRKTHATRLDDLRQSGVSAANLDRIHGPIGLFHAQDPQAVAVSTLAQILSVWPH